MIYLFAIVFLITWAIAIFWFIQHMRIINLINKARYSKIIAIRLKSDTNRVWQTFFESYLFVYANSNATPTDKEFLNFRDSYIQMFRLVIGEEQFNNYAMSFHGITPLIMYLRNVFERHFKATFVGIMVDQNLLNDNAKNEKVR